MKVLLVTTSFPIHQGSTSGLFVKRLADELAKHVELNVVVPDGREKEMADFPYPVCCFRYAPKAMQILAHQPGGLPVALSSKRFRIFLLPIFLVGFFLAIWRKSAGVDVIQANWSLPGLIAGLVGRLKGIPVFTTLRGDDVSNLEGSRLKRTVLMLLLKWNSKLITVSGAMRLNILSLYQDLTARVCHIPNGVDSDFLEIAPLQEHAGALKLLYVGSLIPRKQVDTVVEALGGGCGNATLTVVGDGPERAYLSNRVEQLGLAARVQFLGALPARQIPGILARHEALVLSSKSEGRPNVVLEAMASGRTVVASRLPGVAEIITDGENGLLFDIGDSHALAKIVEELENNRSLNVRLGSAGQKYVLENGLTWESCAQRYIGLFKFDDRAIRSQR